ncbi:aspartate kinase [Nicoliella spurrieriana]|uniref:Aspartokinase n=1 Tax=Nicoliella spurrieriana TaxID=2925830 RepID=A0A976RRF8_9LACO|nr:aspartate kinase [Nicoliella spurrieriana]UQS86256.1 aspartate kinase [Nicoliella spurrieriana]
MTKIIKFGGSSLANGSQYQKVIDIINADNARQIIVVSAPGKRFDDDIKVTDLLIKYANQTIQNQATDAVLQTIIERYQSIADHFQVPAAAFQVIPDTLAKLPTQTYPNDEYLMAAFKAHGEKLNAELMALVLNQLGIKSRFVDPKEAGITVSDEPNSATVLPETYQNLGHFGYGDEKLIFPGFFGVTKDGNIATFARGGSDITGSIVARGLNIPMYENFTDVSAIYAANPKIIKNPIPIKKMTYREMRELSYAGFSVFNDEAIIPAIEGKVTINVRNTNDPEAPGTLIVPEGGFQSEHQITGVASSGHFSALYLHRYLLNKEVGFTLKLLNIFYKYDISYEHMPSGIDDLTVIFDNRQLTPEKMKAVGREIHDTLHPDKLNWITDYAILMVVGEGMVNMTDGLSKSIDPLAEDGIKVNMINQGASQISIMIGTRKADANRAVKDIYNQFFNQQED